MEYVSTVEKNEEDLCVLIWNNFQDTLSSEFKARLETTGGGGKNIYVNI